MWDIKLHQKMILFQFVRKIILSLLPLLVIYFFKSQNDRKEHKIPFIVDKDKIEEGVIINEKK